MWYDRIMEKTKNTPDTTKTRDWPSTVRTRDELDSALEAGLKSGISERTTEEIFESAIARVKNGQL